MKRIQVVLLLFAIVPMFAITQSIAGTNNHEDIIYDCENGF